MCPALLPQSPLSAIVLDDVERLLEYVAIGPRFSNVVLQTLLVLLKKPPPLGRRLFVIGTTSLGLVMQEMDMAAAFNVALNVPRLRREEIRGVLQHLGAFQGPEVSEARARVRVRELFLSGAVAATSGVRLLVGRRVSSLLLLVLVFGVGVAAATHHARFARTLHARASLPAAHYAPLCCRPRAHGCLARSSHHRD